MLTPRMTGVAKAEKNNGKKTMLIFSALKIPWFWGHHESVEAQGLASYCINLYSSCLLLFPYAKLYAYSDGKSLHYVEATSLKFVTPLMPVTEIISVSSGAYF